MEVLSQESSYSEVSEAGLDDDDQEDEEPEEPSLLDQFDLGKAMHVPSEVQLGIWDKVYK